MARKTPITFNEDKFSLRKRTPNTIAKTGYRAVRAVDVLTGPQETAF